MNETEQSFLKALGPEYNRDSLPHVYFADHAVEDATLTAKSGRPRFKNAVYINKTSKTSTTAQWLGKATEQDKLIFPDEWAHYLKVRENLREIRIGLLPAIDMATTAEMNALGIFNLKQLVAQEHFSTWKELARRILDATDATQRSIERKNILSDDQLQTLGALAADTQPVILRERSYNEVKEQEITFSYDVKVA